MLDEVLIFFFFFKKIHECKEIKGLCRKLRFLQEYDLWFRNYEAF